MKTNNKYVSHNTQVARTQGFTLIELSIAIVIIALLSTIALLAYNGIVQNAKVTKSKALVSVLSQAKSAYAADPNTVAADLSSFDTAPSFGPLAKFIRVNGQQPSSEANMLTLSGMPTTGVTISYGTIDNTSFGGTGIDTSPSVSGYGL